MLRHLPSHRQIVVGATHLYWDRFADATFADASTQPDVQLDELRAADTALRTL